MSPAQSRGKLASFIGPAYGFFLVAQYGANCGYAKFCTGWRVSFAVHVAVAVAYGVVMLLVPRTPRCVSSKGSVKDKAISNRLLAEGVNGQLKELSQSLK